MTTLIAPPAPSVTLGPFATVPNYVTLARTIVAVSLGALAITEDSLGLLAAAYAVYWIGDMADGWLARQLDQETRVGAVLDIISDRACTSVLCIGLVTQLPAVATVAVVFLLSFMVMDTMLSLAFLCWPLISPYDFHLVDPLVWKLNWSPIAKAANTAGVVAAVAVGAYSLALSVALAVVAVKIWSAVRVVRLLERR